MDLEVDRLSSLPDDLIHKILSFVDIAYSIRLSVLSSRWRFIWTSMPNLSFASHQVLGSSPHPEFVNNVLSGRNNKIDVSSVSLILAVGDTRSSVERILEYAFSHNVQHLSIRCNRYSEFPLSLLSSKSLKHLTMTATTIDCGSYSPWDLAALTTLHLHHVRLFDCSSIFGTFQNLKNLTLERCQVIEGESSKSFTINSSRLLNLTLKEVAWYLDFVHVDTPQLKNLIFVDTPPSYRQHYYGSRISGSPAELTISARDLTYLLLKGSYLFVKLSVDGSLEKVDLCISSPPKTDVHKIWELFHHLRSVKSLALSLEILELLSSSVEVISHQPSPFASLKSIKIYPTQLDHDNAAMTVKLSTEVKNYLLEGSPNATVTMVSREEARAMKNTNEVRRLIADLREYLQQIEANIEKNRGDVELKKTLVDSCYRNDFRIMTAGRKFDEIFYPLREIKGRLTNVLASKRVEMQACFFKLCADAETTVNKILDDMKSECDIKRSIFGGYFDEFTMSS